MSPENCTRNFASVVCDPCKRRKKSCNKGLPSCNRCSRLLVKCSYSDPEAAGPPVQPSLVKFVPAGATHGQPFSPPPQLWTTGTLPLTDFRPFGVESQVLMQIERLLDSISRKRAPIADICAHYFNTFHHALPIIDKELFYRHLEDPFNPTRPLFSTFLLSICLLEETLSQAPGPKQPRGQLYQTLKAFHSLLQSSGKATIELLQTGILVATYEHCQALHQEAWVSIGTCARIGHLLGLHTLVREAKPKNDETWAEFETRRCTWWAIVVLERVVNAVYENNRLPLASDPPNPEDFLPQRSLEDLHLDPPRVADDVLLPQQFKQEETELNRDSSRFSPFATTIQAAYLSQLVTQHVLNSPEDPDARKMEAAKLEAALQHFTGACIPPPGKAIGRYCGPYGIRINALFYLHHHELDLATAEGDKDAITRAITALQSLSRMTVFATKSAYTGNPIDPEGIAFWAHRHLYLATMVHIKLCPRDEEWNSDLWFLKDYLTKTVGSYEISNIQLQEVEAAEAEAACGLYHTPESMSEKLQT